MRKQFWYLYKKELKESATFLVIFCILSLGWLFFLGAQKDNWHIELVFGLSFIPLGLLPLYVIAKGFLSFRGEWKDDTIYAIKALPVPGWYFVVSKFLATMTSFTLLTLVILGGIYLLSIKYINILFSAIPRVGGIGWFWKDLIFAYLVIWLVIGLHYIISQFSYLVSHLFSKFTELITGVTFLLSYWFMLRVAGLTIILFKWLPDVSVTAWNYYAGINHMNVIELDSAPGIALLLLGIGFVCLGSWLLENVLEV